MACFSLVCGIKLMEFNWTRAAVQPLQGPGLQCWITGAWGFRPTYGKKHPNIQVFVDSASPMALLLALQ